MTLSKTIALAWLLAACEHDSNVGNEVDASVEADASTGDVALAGTCTPGQDRLVLAGPVALETQQIASVTSGGKVVGVGGMHSGNTVAFSVRNIISDDVDAVGTYDVSTTNMKQIESAPGGDCSTAGACNGFFALAGTYTVLEIQPRYRATFTLTNLFERHDITNTPGAALAGTVTGCLDVPAP